MSTGPVILEARGVTKSFTTPDGRALPADQLTAQPMAGDLFRVRLNVRGQEEPYFG